MKEIMKDWAGELTLLGLLVAFLLYDAIYNPQAVAVLFGG